MDSGQTKLEEAVDEKEIAELENGTAGPIQAESIPEKFDPLAGLTPKQLTKLERMREKFAHLEGKEREFVDTMCLLRYLRARDYKVKKAEALLQDTLKWRREYKPEVITREEVAKEAASAKMYVNGARDKLGRPLVMMRPVRDNTGSEERIAKVKYLVWTMEKAVSLMQPERGIEKLALVVDMTGMKVGMTHDIRISMECLNILQNHYPERLGIAIFINPPWLFWGFWKIISPFLNNVTKKKVLFVKGKELHKLLEYFDADQLEPDLGGTNDWVYDHEAWLRGEDKYTKQKPK